MVLPSSVGERVAATTSAIKASLAIAGPFFMATLRREDTFTREFLPALSTSRMPETDILPVSESARLPPYPSFLKYAWVWVGLICLGLILGLPVRAIHADDAWLGDYAYGIFKTGHVRTDILGTYLHYPERLLVFHKGFIPQGAWVIALFGFHPLPLKALGLAYGLLALILLFRIARLEKLPLQVAWATIFLMVCHSVFFEYAGVFRPETAVLAAGLASFLCLRQYFEDSRIGWALAAGALAGLSAYFHLNGLAFMGAAVGTFVLHKQWQAAGWAGVASIGIASLYFADLWQPGHWALYQLQLHGDPALDGTFVWYRPFLNIVKEHERYFHSPRELFFSLGCVCMAFACGRPIWRKHGLLTLWLGLAMLGLAIVAHGKTSKYLTYFIPLLSLLWMAGFTGVAASKPIFLWLKRISVVCILLHVVASLYVDVDEFILPAHGNAQRKELREMQAAIGSQSVIGPLELAFFREPGPSLRYWEAYKYKNEAGDICYNLPKAIGDGYHHFLLENSILGELLPDSTGFTRLRNGERYVLYEAK